MKIKKNDLVKVISGNSKGSEGKVLKVFPEAGRVIVEKVHMIKRHTRKQQTPGGAAGGHRGEGSADPYLRRDARVPEVRQGDENVACSFSATGARRASARSARRC